MKLSRMTFLGVRGVPDATFDLSDPGTGAPFEVVLVTGGVASGKTRVLEAIVAAKEAIAPYDKPIRGESWIAEGDVAKVGLSFHLDPEESGVAGTSREVLEAEVMFLPGRAESFAAEGLRAVLARYTHRGKCGKLEYFPAKREIPRHEGGPFGVASQGALRPSKAENKYAIVRRFVRELGPDAEAGDAFDARLRRLSPTCRYDANDACFRSRGGPAATLDELSDAERDAVLLAATAMAIDLHCSLVLVDRPELHALAGPALLAGLRSLGEDNQLILAVRSPELLGPLEGVRVIELGGG